MKGPLNDLEALAAEIRRRNEAKRAKQVPDAQKKPRKKRGKVTSRR